MKFLDLKIIAPLTAAMMAALSACSSDSSSSEESEDLDPIVDSYADLPTCDEEESGSLYIVRDEMAAYRCRKGKWTYLSNYEIPETIRDTTIIHDTTQVNVHDTTLVNVHDTTLVNKKVYLCGEDEYDPKTQSCQDNVIIDGLCNNDTRGSIQASSTEDKYTCTVDSKGKLVWRVVTEVEEVLNSNECDESKAGETTTFGYSNYICDGENGWTFDYDNLKKGELKIGEQVYATVGIGKQMWMAENLNYTDSTAHPNLKGEVSCYGKNDDTNCDALGAYYSWTAAMDFPADYADSVVGDKIKEPHQGICPDGWHIPSLKDWDMLNDFVIGTNATDTTAGTGLKAQSSWRDVVTSIDTTTNDTSKYSGNGNNAYGFNAYSGGTIKYTDGSYKSTEKGTFALFIVADELVCTYDYMDGGKCRDYLTPIRADLRFDKLTLRYLQSDTYTRKTRMSVRCVADEYKD